MAEAQISFTLPETLYRRVKIVVAERGMTVNHLRLKSEACEDDQAKVVQAGLKAVD